MGCSRTSHFEDASSPQTLCSKPRSSPSDPKHATIPSNTFMPGKDGSTPRDTSSLYGLVRLLHRQHNELFAGIPRRDGFVSQDPHSFPCDPVDTQARGFGDMVAFWERMRNICPKVNIYNGPILREDGSQCRTALDLDEAMLATRKFWFEKPVEQDERWANVLRVYATSDMWPDVLLPCKKIFCTHCFIQKILPLVLMAFLILLGGYSLNSLWMP